jgi:DNA-binding protein H-NS
MTKTYSQLMEEIDALKREAEALRRQEVEGVIARIKEAVAFYGLTAEDLGLARGSPARAARDGAARKPAARASARRTSPPKYRDDQGNVWSGRGPRPRWFKEALAAGRRPEEFAARGR